MLRDRREAGTVEDLTHPATIGPPLALVAGFDIPADKTSYITIAALATEPSHRLCSANPPKVPIIVPGKLLIISSQDCAQLTQSDGGTITDAGAIRIIVVDEALKPVPEEPTQIQHFILHSNFLFVAGHRPRRRKAAWYWQSQSMGGASTFPGVADVTLKLCLYIFEEDTYLGQRYIDNISGC
jgi:hypothetical protein